MRRMVRWWAVGSLVAALAVGPAAPAEAAQGHSTVRATPASVRVGQVLVVAGTATHLHQVEVERLVGHSWRPLAKAPVARGSYAIGLRAPSKPTTWRLRVGAERIVVHVVRTGYAITAVTAPLLAEPGRIAVSGSVSPHATGVVWLQRKVSGVWHDLGTAVVHADSSYLVHTAGTPGTYRLRVRKAAGSRVAAGYSPAATVVVQRPVTAPVVTGVNPAAGNVVRAWGANTAGQLGNGTTSPDTPSPTPAVVPGLTGAIGVAAGDDNGYALRFDGTVMAWGDGSYGQLGTGATTSSLTPVTVPGLTNVTAISASSDTVLALKNDGTVWAWGSGDQGELGSGGTDDSDVPRQIVGLQGVTAVASAGRTGYALLGDGTVRAWGDNTDGQVGDGTTNTELSPVLVTGLSGVTAIAAGTADGYALRVDGTVWAWGSNTAGALGDGDALGNDSSVPVRVVGVSGSTAIAAGRGSGYAVVAGGAVMAWGDDEAGQLDTGDPGIFDVTPAPMNGLMGVTALAADGLDSFALSGGLVLATGDNGQGQLGNGDLTVTGVLAPQPVVGIAGAIAVAAGLQDGYAITRG